MTNDTTEPRTGPDVARSDEADAAAARSAFGTHVERFETISPLLARWADRVADGGALSDHALARIAGTQELTRWIGVVKVFAAVVAVLLDDESPTGTPQPVPGGEALAARVPLLGGAALVDDEFDTAVTAFTDEHLDAVLAFLPRLPVRNDPADGIAMWRAVPAEAQGADLLVIGAGAGLELVAAALDPSIPWAARSRKGIDIAPIDVHDDVSMRWLLGVCSPDDPERFEQTVRAIGIARSQGVRVEEDDAVSAIRSAGSDRLVVMGGSVLCMFSDPTEVVKALAARQGTTWFVSDEVVQVHRAAGHGEGLEGHEPGDRVVRVIRFGDGAATFLV